jgi:hypothetical protein
LNDGFSTVDIHFCAAMMYLFGDEALTKITAEEDVKQRGRTLKTFHLDIPSLDAFEYQKDFQEGRLAISDLKSYVRSHSWITHCMGIMNRKHESAWVSPAWIAGRGR